MAGASSLRVFATLLVAWGAAGCGGRIARGRGVCRSAVLGRDGSEMRKNPVIFPGSKINRPMPGTLVGVVRETFRKMLVVSALPELESKVQDNELSVGLIESCKQGDRQALEAFVHCYERRVFAYLTRSLGTEFPIEDLAQDVFLRAYRSLARFDVCGKARLSTWLLAIAHHVVVDARRSRRIAVSLEPEDYPSSGMSPEQLLGREQLRAALTRAIEQLPDEQRDVFVLAEFQGLSSADIARVVGAFEATVKTRLFRARARLRSALRPLIGVEP